MKNQTQENNQLLVNQVIDSALREVDEMGLDEIEVIPELSSELGMDNDDFSWLDDVLRVEN